jgi:hypothetical protein
MKFALDFDGTIANTNEMKSKLIGERLGIEIPGWKCDRTLCVPIVGLDVYNEIADEVYDRPSTLRTPPVDDAPDFIKKLAGIAELYLLTARPGHRMAFAMEWLEKYEIKDCFKDFFTSHIDEKQWRLKLDICREQHFDLLMDDDQRHFEVDGNDEIIKVLIKNGCHSEIELPEATKLVRDWNEFYQFCMEEVLAG